MKQAMYGDLRCPRRAFFCLLLALTLPAQVVTTVAGTEPVFRGDGLPAVQAPFGFIIDVAVDRDGNLLIADADDATVAKVGPDKIVRAVAGNGIRGFSGDGGPAINASIQYMSAIAADSSGNFYIADPRGHRIRKVTPSGIISTLAGTGQAGFSGDGGPASKASFNFEGNGGVAADGAGNIYVADRGNNRIRKISADG